MREFIEAMLRVLQVRKPCSKILERLAGALRHYAEKERTAKRALAELLGTVPSLAESAEQVLFPAELDLRDAHSAVELTLKGVRAPITLSEFERYKQGEECPTHRWLDSYRANPDEETEQWERVAIQAFADALNGFCTALWALVNDEWVSEQPELREVAKRLNDRIQHILPLVHIGLRLRPHTTG